MNRLFNVEFGHSLLKRHSQTWPSYIVMTTPTPWRLAQRELSKEPVGIGFVTDLQVRTLDSMVSKLPRADLVVAIGGAGCQEAAKYYGRAKGVERVHIPTTVSNNAAVATSNTILFDDIRHVIFGLDPPKAVLVDFDLIRQARPFVNRCGLGEHLCIHTGLFDWRLASSKGLGLPWDHALAREMARLELRAITAAPGMRDLSADTIRELVAIWIRVGELMEERRCMNFAGASEHIFALNLARTTGKRLLHGQTVSLGVVVMSLIQRNAPEIMAEAHVAAGARFKPQDIGCTWEDVAKTLCTLTQHAHRMREDAPYSIADEMRYDPGLLDEVRAFVDAYPTPEDDGWSGFQA